MAISSLAGGHQFGNNLGQALVMLITVNLVFHALFIFSLGHGLEVHLKASIKLAGPVAQRQLA
jgi:hypothetical protein